MKAFLPEQTRLSQVHLRTTNLKEALAFYTGVLGLKPLPGLVSQAILSSAPEGPALLVLSEGLDSQPRSSRSTGLYHFAIRYPTRQDLAHAYQRLAQSAYPLVGASDHGVSEAIYLCDPDGNGVELYADRPRAAWAWRHGEVAVRHQGLDLKELLEIGQGSTMLALPGQADLGHIHLHVADLRAAERFYSEFLGLAVTQRSYPGALFFAAGGYHHHLAVNVWAGRSALPVRRGGLLSYRLEVPVKEVLYCLRHRAPLLGYETRAVPQEEGNSILQIRDPNGTWLEVKASVSERSVPAETG